MDFGRRTQTQPLDLASASRSREASSKAGQLTLLIVEDHVDSAAALSLLLRHEGYNVCIAHTAAQAIRLAGEKHFDLVLTDIGLPDADGCELMSELHYRHNLNGIAMTGNDGPDDPVHLSTSGFVEKVLKPINFDQLFSAIHQATDSGPAS